MTTALPAQLTLRDAQSALEGLSAGLAASAGEAVWQIDAGALTQLDTSAIAVLLECRRLAAAQKRTLELLNPPARLVELARLYGVEGLIGAPAAVASSHASGAA